MAQNRTLTFGLERDESASADRGAQPLEVLHSRFGYRPATPPETALPDTAAELQIASETRTLANGLRVVVHEDRSAPLVAVHLMYRAGSRDERPGRTGLAHLLEHLLFEGSQNTPKGQYDDLLERVGGTNNGSTWLDRTNYYITVPSNAVELALWLERDRMGFFLPTLTAETLELQRGVVINERRQSYESRPYGMAEERLHQMLFAADHPYSWPTIGYMEDLERIELADVLEFYQRFYSPANGVLVLAGDMDPAEAFSLAERYFGDLPHTEVPAAEYPLGPVATAASRDQMEDDVSFPRVYQAFSVPGYGTREWAALDVLAYLLADGDSSRLYRALIREGQLAQEVDTYLYPTALCGVFGIVATARAGIAPETLEAAMRAGVEEVARGEITPDELTGAIRRVRRDHVAELATVEERAEALAYAATVLGSADAANRVMDLYETVTAEELRHAAARWLDADRGVVLTVVPAPGQEDDHA
jgi:zinc protease